MTKKVTKKAAVKTIKVQKRDTMGRFASGFTTKRVASAKKSAKRCAR